MCQDKERQSAANQIEWHHQASLRPTASGFFALYFFPYIVHPLSTTCLNTCLYPFSSSTMAANTKYQAAPQRDSFEEPNYTQAPPSYQAEASNNTLLGQPRGEDDNVPDDFKVSYLWDRISYHG